MTTIVSPYDALAEARQRIMRTPFMQDVLRVCNATLLTEYCQAGKGVKVPLTRPLTKPQHEALAEQIGAWRMTYYPVRLWRREPYLWFSPPSQESWAETDD